MATSLLDPSVDRLSSDYDEETSPELCATIAGPLTDLKIWMLKEGSVIRGL